MKSIICSGLMLLSIGQSIAAGLPPPASPKVWKKSSDGYYFEKPTFTRTQFPLEIVLVKDEKEMKEQIQKRGGKIVGDIRPGQVAAFSVIRNEDETCTIYMIDPKVNYKPELIGHELVHCIYGMWHSEPQN